MPISAGRYPAAEEGVHLEIQTPPGWHRFGVDDGLPPFVLQPLAFVMTNRPKDVNLEHFVELSVAGGVEAANNIFGKVERQNPRNTVAVTAYGPGSSQSLTFARLETFDGKQNGRLTLWKVRPAHDGAYPIYLTIISSGFAWANVWLRCDDPKLLKECLKVLKEEARTLRIVRRNDGSEKTASRVRKK